MPRLWAVLAALTLSAAGLTACAPTPIQPATGYGLPSRPPPTSPPPRPVPLPSLADLPGWAEENHLAAFRAYAAGCAVARDPALQAVCERARRLAIADDGEAKRFFEASFRPEVIPGAGLLTAYFAPEYPARASPDAVFSAPLRGRPADLALEDPGPLDPPGRKVPRLMLGGTAQPYPDRTAIELVPPDQALAWMRPEDLFFLQVQGSGGLVFPDGRRMKAVYAADNGQPFVPIAPAMVKQGLLAPSHASGESIRAWLAAHRGPEAQAVMDLDPRYVFFTLVPDDGHDPVGAAGVPLTAGRAIAIDPSFASYGEVYWIDAVSPVLAGAMKSYRRLVLALDTGSAIRGRVRADLYLGRGEAAGLEAGRVRHTLLMIRLVPASQAGRRGEDEAAAPGGGD